MRAVIAATTLVLGLAGCATSSDAPDWFAERSAQDDGGFPSLREVPRGHLANTDAEHWATVEADLRAAGEALRTSPRAAPASAVETPEEFLDEAREDLDEARESHDPQ